MTRSPDRDVPALEARAPAPARWLVLGAFAALVAATQVLWLSFAPITAQAHVALGVSEGAIGDLAVVNPLTYVLLAIPAGRWMDRRFGAALATGALLTAAGAVLRAVAPGAYGWALAGQIVLSVGQPLVLNATTKVAARYFPPPERTAAISVASAAQFVGILVAALAAEPLANAGGLRRVLLTHAVLAVVCAVALLVMLRTPPSFVADADAVQSLGWLRHDPLMWRLAGLLFIGVGVFNAVATWLDTILADFGHPGVSGSLIAVMTVAGIAGAALVPGAAARRNGRRSVLVATTLLTVLVFLALAVVHSTVFVAVALALEGFLLLSCLPIALDWSELDAGPARAGTATGFLLLAGNLGGVVFVLVVQALIGDPRVALVAIAAIAVPGVALTVRLPASARSHLDDDRPLRRGAV